MLRTLHLRPSHVLFRRLKMSDSASLSTAIAEQTSRLNALRLQKDATPGELEEVKKKLGELKKALGEINKANALAAAGSGRESGAPDSKKRERMLLKTAKVGIL
jgi:histidyl-tRNA synthetase